METVGAAALCCRAILTFAMLVSLTGISTAQLQGPRLTFDVVSIHPSNPEAIGGVVKPMLRGTGYTVQNMTVKTMMSVMYRIPGSRIVGGPDWFDSQRYDVLAKADHESSLHDLHTMFQNLLADRFGLKFHIETKTGPVYELVVDKSGVKMKADGVADEMRLAVIPKGPGEFVGTKVPMSYLCFFLGQQITGTDRPVIDKTGLTQAYDFTLTFLPDFPGVPTDKLDPQLQARPALFDAVKEQLGLKLELTRGPVDSFVIDHIERPTEN